MTVFPVIKNSPEIMLNIIHKFINLCLDKCLVPKTWSLELISLVHKKGNKNDPVNFRGICVSSPLLNIL